MGNLKKYTPFFISALLMCLAVFIIYPYYQYYIDPDGTSYLTIARRYAAADYDQAINGYWSPWACWLTAYFMKKDIADITASVIVNATAAIGFLYISQSFFLLLGVNRRFQWSFNIALALFLPFAIFWQSFDDLWECFFLLCTLRLMLHEHYKTNPGLWVLTGIIGALAYYAKAYAFPFFILNTICCSFFILKIKDGGSKARWLLMCAVSILMMLIYSSPWLYLLYRKYDMLTTSTAGPLNMSWYLVGHPLWKPGITTFLPPPYADAPYYWEDPYLVNGLTPHFWDSFYLFGLQIARIIYTVLKFIGSLFQLSVFFPVIFIRALLIVFSKKSRIFLTTRVTVTTLSFLLFPLGYLLINFESRYIWYMLPLGMAIGALAIQHYTFTAKRLQLITILLTISFLVYPAFKYVAMFRDGEKEYNLAQQIKAAHIQGGFTGNASPVIMARLAYFSETQFYCQAQTGISYTALIKDMRIAHVPYYFYFYKDEKDKNFMLTDASGMQLLLAAALPGVLIFNVQ